MSYSFARGLAAAVSGYSQGVEEQRLRERQEKADAVAEERLNRERAQWQETDKQRATFNEEREKIAAKLDQPIVVDPYPLTGTDRPKITQDLSDAPAPTEPNYVKSNREALASSARMATNGSDLSSAFARLNQLQMNSESASLANFIEKDASPADLQRMMGNVKLDKTNSYEPVYDPATGMTRIKKGDTEVELNRADLGKLVAAQHRLKNGDASAQDVVDSIYAKREKQAADSLRTADTLARSDNDASYRAQIVGARNASVAVAAQKANAQKTGSATAANRLGGASGIGTNFAQAAALMKDIKLPNEGVGNATAFNALASTYAIDPSTPAPQAVLAAQDIALNGANANVVPRLDFNKGAVVLNHINGDGVQTPVRYAQSGFKPTEEQVAGFQQDVSSYLAREDAHSPGLGNLINLAARGDKSATAALPTFIAGRSRERLYELIKDRAVTPQQKAQAIAEVDARVALLLPGEMATVNKALSLIKTYSRTK